MFVGPTAVCLFMYLWHAAEVLLMMLVILKILHDLSILWYHYSQGLGYLGSCRILVSTVVLSGKGSGSKTADGHFPLASWEKSKA